MSLGVHADLVASPVRVPRGTTRSFSIGPKRDSKSGKSASRWLPRRASVRSRKSWDASTQARSASFQASEILVSLNARGEGEAILLRGGLPLVKISSGG